MMNLQDTGYYIPTGLLNSPGSEHETSLIPKRDTRQYEFKHDIRNMSYNTGHGFNPWQSSWTEEPLQVNDKNTDGVAPQAPQWHSYDKNTGGVLNTTPKYPQYISTKSRYATFKNIWPVSHHIKPMDLAMAGFFYRYVSTKALTYT
jgi:hypothetical protein